MRYTSRIEARVRRAPRRSLLSLAGLGALLTPLALLLGRRLSQHAQASRERAGYRAWNTREW